LENTTYFCGVNNKENNKMKFIFVFALLIPGFFSPIFSQELTYNSDFVPGFIRAENPVTNYFVFITSYNQSRVIEEIKSINETDVRKHALGDEIAKRLYLLDLTYTYESEPAPGAFTGKRVIKKPTIYFSIYKIEKYYRKKVKSLEIPEEAAITELSAYIDLSIILFEENTSEFESALKESDKDLDLISTFKRVKIEPY